MHVFVIHGINYASVYVGQCLSSLDSFQPFYIQIAVSLIFFFPSDKLIRCVRIFNSKSWLPYPAILVSTQPSDFRVLGIPHL